MSVPKLKKFFSKKEDTSKELLQKKEIIRYKKLIDKKLQNPEIAKKAAQIILNIMDKK